MSNTEKKENNRKEKNQEPSKKAMVKKPEETTATVASPQEKKKGEQPIKQQPPKVSLQQFAGTIESTGIVDRMPEGYAFLRASHYNYLASQDDVYLSHHLIRQWGLKRGDTVKGKLRPPKDKEKFFGLTEIQYVNGCDLARLRRRRDFQHLTTIYPQDRFRLSCRTDQYGMRLLELFVPIGYGQRVLVAASPKAGKTTLLKEITQGINQNHPEVYVIVLMIGERPEEVTDMRRSVKAEVIASTFDEDPEHHVKVAKITIEKAKRMVECGHHVVVVLDSLTRLTRAHNLSLPSSGKILSGGVDANALHIAKWILGAARNTEEAGSLTMIASVLVETGGSKMDDMIFQECKATGNAEIQLNRDLVHKGLFPAIDLQRSGTRRWEDLIIPEQQKYINMLRRVISDMNNPEESLKFILNNMRGTKSNEEFLASVHN